MSDARTPDASVQSVMRALTLLRELNRRHVSSVMELHAATGLPKPTIVRLLKTLCEARYVTNDRRQGGYQVTASVKELSCGYHGDPLVVEAARPWAIEFTRTYRWPIAVAVLDQDAVTVRFSTISDSPVSPFHATINRRFDLLTRALGRSYLAFCPDRERQLLLDGLQLSQAERGAALAMLSRIRDAGFALRDPHVEPRSSNTIAVPITLDGPVLATVGMTYFTSTYRLPQAVEIFVPILHALARRISESAAALSSATSAD